MDRLLIALSRLGFGPVELDAIDIRGDVTLDEASARAKSFRTGLIRVGDYFGGASVKTYSGPPAGGPGKDYCWGWCPGAIEILRQF